MTREHRTLRVLDAERHVDTEPVAEYWVPTRDAPEPAWVRAYRKLAAAGVGVAGGGVAALGFSGIFAGSSTEGETFEAATKAAFEAVPTAALGMAVGLLLLGLAHKMYPGRMSGTRYIAYQAAWAFGSMILGGVLGA